LIWNWRAMSIAGRFHRLAVLADQLNATKQ
jgi:hypothetical protein